jgi:membrane protein implicated in regulation of membrane protease activity
MVVARVAFHRVTHFPLKNSQVDSVLLVGPSTRFSGSVSESSEEVQVHIWVWLALAGGFIVVELLTLSLIFFSFAIAALGGALGAALWRNSNLQWVTFAIVAVLTLAFLRPLARKYLFKKNPESRTGMDALILSPAKTLTMVDAHNGTIRLRNETWTARSESEVIPKGIDVTVTRIDGAVAIVIPTFSTHEEN